MPRGQQALRLSQGLIGRGGGHLGQELTYAYLGLRSYEFVEHLAIPKGLDRRDALYAIGRGDLRIVVYVELGEQKSAARLAGQALEQRAERPARNAPGRPE